MIFSKRKYGLFIISTFLQIQLIGLRAGSGHADNLSLPKSSFILVKMKLKPIYWLWILCTLVFSCSEKSSPNEISIFAAAGTRLPVQEICDSISAKSDITLMENFASSGTLARQIANGAKADLFFSANKQWMDFLIEENIIIDSTVQQIAKNKLVIIVPKREESILFDSLLNMDKKLLSGKKVALGDPAYVPVGKYAEQALKNLQWLEFIDKNRILCKDVTSVLRFVEMGECSWGIVYFSEAQKSDKVKIAALLPEELYEPIKFYCGLVEGYQTGTYAVAEQFHSETARQVFKKHGFKME